MSRRIASRLTRGVIRSEISAADANATTRSGSTSPNVAIRRIGGQSTPRGSPGTGKRATSSRTSARIRSWAASSSRSRIASTIQAPICAISAGPMPRVVVAGVPTRIPDATLGGFCVERDRVLVDGDPDVVEEGLGLAAGDPQRRHVDEREVVVGAAADQARARVGEGLREHAGVLDRPGLVAAEVARRPRA